MSEPQISKKERLAKLNEEAKALNMSVISDKESPEFMLSLKFDIKTLLDVGVHQGTPFLYKAYADKNVVLIDPSPVSYDLISKRFPKLIENFNRTALGDEPGELELSLLEGGSSLMEASDRPLSEDPRFKGTLKVPVVRLDDLIAQKGYEGPFGLKLDVEGFEMHVLRGATDTLKNCQFVIAEVSLRQRFANSYYASEIIAFLAEAGFEFLTILNEKAGLQRYYDCLFARRENPWITTKS